MRVLGLVVARGGSKGVPRKNVRPLAGRPLIAYTVAAARQAECFARLVISTDDREIADVAAEYGCEVPFLRPAELASDGSPVLLSIQHAIRTLEEGGDRFDAMCLLQPTTPFRSPQDLRAGIELMDSRPDSTSVVSLTEIIDHHPRRLRRIVDGKIQQYLTEGGDREGQQRQDHGDDPAYRRCGAFYLSRHDTMMVHNTLYGDVCLPYVMPAWRSVTIDEEEDFLMCEAMLNSPRLAEKLAHVHRFFE